MYESRLDISEVRKWYDLFKNNNELVEIRLIGNGGRTASGYFTDVDTLIREVEPYTNEYNVYFTVNKVHEGCYGRAQKNCIVQKPKETTTDKEIIARDWVFLDLDTKRITGTNATDEQVAITKQKANEVYKFLKDNGFNEPIVAFSSNGVHLYLKCSLAPTEENNTLIKRFTQAMGMLFSDDNVDVDAKVFNLGRIARLPGSYSNKGSKNDDKMPQRMCKIIKYPKEVKSNDKEYFEKIAKLFPEDARPTRDNNYTVEKFDLDGFLSKHNIQVTKIESVAGGRKIILDHCCFNENHRGKDAVIFQRDTGEVAFHCFHSSCEGKTWRDVRLLYEPNAYDRKFSDYPRHKEYYERKREFEPIVKSEEKGEIWLKMSQIKRPKFDLMDYIPSGIKQIDDLIIGFKRKHVTVWSGYRGCGKTTLLNMLILNAAQQGYKSALWTGELDGDEEKKWLYLQASGKAFNKRAQGDFYFTPDHVSDKIDPWIDKYFWIFNNEYGNNFKGIIDKVTELATEHGLDVVLLDNLMTLDVGDLDGDKNEKQKNLMFALTCLAKKLNIHIHIVAHPNKSGTFLRPNNISGSGHIPDLAQNVIIAHRINLDFETNAKEFLPPKTISDILDSRCTNSLEICKCRDKGSATDRFINLFFEIESNRLKNDIAESIHYGWEEQPQQQSFEMPYVESEFSTNEFESFDTDSFDPFGGASPF